VTVTTDELDNNIARPKVDLAIFEAAFLEHWPKVYTVLLRLVGERAEAEDLALETFWRLYRRAPGVLAQGDPGGWLYRSATNLGLNALRAAKRRKAYEDQAGRHALENNPAPDPSVEAERSEQRQQVRAVLQQMKPRHARLLVLRHAGLSYAEVAATLNVAPSSVGTLLTRAEKEFEERYRKLEGN
jgi:RNA polymerase sigma-70 factor (ECF subfamily)